MKHLTPEDESLIARAREGLEPGAEDHARIKRRLFGQIAAGTVAATVALSTSAEAAGAGIGAGTAVGIPLLAKVVAVGVIGAAIVGGGIVATRKPTAATTAVAPTATVAQVAPAAEPSAPRAVALSELAFEVPPPASSAATPPRATTSPTHSLHEGVAAAAGDPPPSPGAATAGPPDVRAEAELLHRAQAALEMGDPARALALVDQHAASFPGGVLYPEREAERAVILCALGRPEAKPAASSFLHAYPHSPLAARVRAKCDVP